MNNVSYFSQICVIKKYKHKNIRKQTIKQKKQTIRVKQKKDKMRDKEKLTIILL